MADPTRFLTKGEVLRILKDLKRRKKRSRSTNLYLHAVESENVPDVFAA